MHTIKLSVDNILEKMEQIGHMKEQVSNIATQTYVPPNYRKGGPHNSSVKFQRIVLTFAVIE